MTDEEIRRLALLGARMRINEIDAERDRLLASFPELLGKKAKREPKQAKRSEPVVLFDAAEHGKQGPAHDKRKRKTDRKLRTFNDEYKAAAVARVKAGEYSTDVANDLGIASQVLRRWCVAAGVKHRPLPESELARRRSEAGARGGKAKAKAKAAGQRYTAPRAVTIRSPEEQADIAARMDRLVQAGATMAGAAKQLGLPPSSAFKIYGRYKKAERKAAKRNGVNGVHVGAEG